MEVPGCEVFAHFTRYDMAAESGSSCNAMFMVVHDEGMGGTFQCTGNCPAVLTTRLGYISEWAILVAV